MATTAALQLDLLERSAAEVETSPAVLNLCATCHARPRHAGGALSRCLLCIKTEAQRDRDARAAAEAIVAARAKAEQPHKRCRTCKHEKPVTEFPLYRGSSDGRRRDCRSCIGTGKTKKRAARSAAEKQRERERARSPERRAKNLESALEWQARNKLATTAHQAVRSAVLAGRMKPSPTCQVLGCRKRKGLHGHHNNYDPRNHKRVVWVCRGHHKSIHTGMKFKTKAAAMWRTAFAPETA